MAIIKQNRDLPANVQPSNYGPEWSVAALLAAILTAVLWGPAYMFVEDRYVDSWWADFAVAFIVMAAAVMLSCVTCLLAKYLQNRQRRDHGNHGGC